MLLPKSKIEKVVCKLESRVYLRHVWLDVEKRRLVATDGHAAAFVPVDPNTEDSTGPVTVDSIAAARKGGGCVTAGVNLQVEGGATFPRPTDVYYPDMDKIIPAAQDREPDVTLDAELLHKLAQAICDGKPMVVQLWLNPDDRHTAIRVAPLTGESFGVIMPARKA